MADDERPLMANITPFGLRMQPDLKGRVEAAAKANTRSLNAEIVARLESSFTGEEMQMATLASVSATLVDATEEANLRRLEFRAMASHMSLLKHIAARLADLHQGEIPQDLEVLLNWMRDYIDAPAAANADTKSLLQQALSALNDLATAQIAHESLEGQQRRNDRFAKTEAARLLLERSKDK